MASVVQTFNTDLGLPPDSYIYRIISTASRQDPLTYSQVDQLAIISSDDSLRFLDPATQQKSVIKNVNEKVTCLERANDAASNVVATAGRDGMIRFWDKRSRAKVFEIESPHKLISSLVCDTQNNFIAAGIENPEDGTGVCPVYIWDQRHPSAPTRTYTDSHTDTITTLALHPSHPTLLLSSSTDGLLSVFDTAQPDEEDALYQVINHRSAIAHAGFMFPGTDIYALGTDETLGVYALQSREEEVQEPSPRLFGDVRGVVGCEYAVGMHWVGSKPYVAVGRHSESSLSLVPVSKGSSGPLDYAFNLDKSIQFPGGHGEELVRDMVTDVSTRTAFTCGEDGFVRAWQMTGDETMSIDEDAEPVKKKKDKDRKEKRKEKKDKKGGDKEKARYKPY